MNLKMFFKRHSYCYKISCLLLALSLCQCSLSVQKERKLNSDAVQFEEYLKITNLAIANNLEWNLLEGEIDQQKFEIKNYQDTLVVLAYLNNTEDFYGFSITMENDKITAIMSYKP